MLQSFPNQAQLLEYPHGISSAIILKIKWSPQDATKARLGSKDGFINRFIAAALKKESERVGKVKSGPLRMPGILT